MAAPEVKIRSFDRRLWLSGSRTSMPAGTLRRCVGAAPELTGSLRSRYGSTLLYPINSISLNRFNGNRIQYDGSALYVNGVSKDTGYNGGRLAFAKMPPNFGVSDYLFVTGGGKLVKLDSSNNVTNWGIQPPLDGAMAQTSPQDSLTFDNFDASAANWTASNCSKADENTIVYAGSGSLKISPTASTAPWSITKDLTGSPLDAAIYADDVISLQTDLNSLWVNLFSISQRRILSFIMFARFIKRS